MSCSDRTKQRVAVQRNFLGVHVHGDTAPRRTTRSLVICLDGTTNEPDPGFTASRTHTASSSASTLPGGLFIAPIQPTVNS